MAFFCNLLTHTRKVFIIYFNIGVVFTSLAQGTDTIENIIKKLSIE